MAVGQSADGTLLANAVDCLTPISPPLLTELIVPVSALKKDPIVPVMLAMPIVGSTIVPVLTRRPIVPLLLRTPYAPCRCV
jgi:hypothetical protein